MTYDLSFHATALTLEQAGVSVNPSEAHGILTGLVCIGIEDDAAALSALGDPGDFPEFGDYVLAARTHIAEGLRAAELDFEPLLPDDNVPVAQRSRALTQWCTGFVAGFYFRGSENTGDHSDTVSEALTDITDLANASGTVSESDLTEIVEYLRVSVQLIYEETREKTA
ncbi:MAG: UPF0149 family protein [Acidiferrobacter sp.]